MVTDYRYLLVFQLSVLCVIVTNVKPAPGKICGPIAIKSTSGCQHIHRMSNARSAIASSATILSSTRETFKGTFTMARPTRRPAPKSSASFPIPATRI
jgi:hypothetical protein